MNVELDLIIMFHDGNVAKSIHNSLQPDNINLPKGLDLHMSLNGRNLRSIFRSTDKVETLISTVDDLLSSCQVSIDSLEHMK